MSLVTIKDGDAVTTTTVIAAGTENEHASVIALVRKYQADFEEFGRVRFEIEPFETSGGVQSREVALLDEPQATLLLTFMRNTEIVRAFKKKLVREFWELVQERNRAKSSMPENYIEALEHLLASKRSEQLALEQRDQAIATKAEIGSRREATAMATASAAVRKVMHLENELGRGCQHATVTAVEKAAHRSFGGQGFRPLKNWCDSHGVSAPKVQDPRFGWVRSWPAAAWAAVYQIDLAELFGAAGEQPC
ncbi:Rha family transcriptional regulator [Pseudomonas mosselii]|uniref:Rha family transcriptional regulator n=1 Tax=Pseudomonas mosselii TaxID=78327 RepID=UPI001E285B9F|nr:Rha family transcriptional regulator [Pseudomonas mosselii]MCL8303105.1 Rha family transcriptional regulator [Pseudomonas mosselii]WJR27802.1 Rha family transcriptional regulator [Pseudomonas mosselii]